MAPGQQPRALQGDRAAACCPDGPAPKATSGRLLSPQAPLGRNRSSTAHPSSRFVRIRPENPGRAPVGPLDTRACFMAKWSQRGRPARGPAPLSEEPRGPGGPAPRLIQTSPDGVGPFLASGCGRRRDLRHQSKRIRPSGVTIMRLPTAPAVPCVGGPEHLDDRGRGGGRRWSRLWDRQLEMASADDPPGLPRRRSPHGERRDGRSLRRVHESPPVVAAASCLLEGRKSSRSEAADR